MLLSKAICLVGPTGSGKTRTAIFLAQKLNAEIINLDSVQIYQELNIGSAKPSIEELAQIPHHLVNIASITHPLSSYDIFQKSIETLLLLKQSQKNMIITGGTGLYYKSLLYGMFEGPSQNKAFRDSIKNIPSATLYLTLKDLDPLSAAKLHPNDFTRIERALEVYNATGKSIVELQKEHRYTPPCPFLMIGIQIDRTLLYNKINSRVDSMVNNGLIKEVQTLVKDFPHNPFLHQTIGYKELIAYFNGEIEREDAIALIKQNSRHFAKRQMTLFRNMEGVHWAPYDDEESMLRIINDNAK